MTGAVLAAVHIAHTSSCAASSLHRVGSLPSSQNRTPGSFAAGWSQHTPLPSHTSVKITSSATSSAECAIVSATINFMTLTIRQGLADTAHAFVIVLDSVSNHTRSRAALRVWASASGRGTSDSAFNHALSEFRIRLRLKPAYKTGIGNNTVMIGRAALAHDGCEIATVFARRSSLPQFRYLITE